jgi:cytochrome c peroxidase
MNALNHLRACLLLCGLLVVLHTVSAPTQSSKEPDGQHDFDFEIGTWKTHLSRLLHPLSGSTTWAEYEGTTAVRKVWDGRANLVELQADGPAGPASVQSAIPSMEP